MPIIHKVTSFVDEYQGVMIVLDTAKIRKLRKQRGWDQREFAQNAAINPSVISRLERGMQDDFKFSIIVSIANCLGVTIDQLLKQEYQTNNPKYSTLLASSLERLSQHDTKKQNEVAGMINGFLSIIEQDFDNGS